MSRNSYTPNTTPGPRHSRVSSLNPVSVPRPSIPPSLLDASFSTSATDHPFAPQEKLSHVAIPSLSKINKLSEALESKLKRFSLLNERICAFNYRFASFLTALQVNSHCVDFALASTAASEDFQFQSPSVPELPPNFNDTIRDNTRDKIATATEPEPEAPEVAPIPPPEPEKPKRKLSRKSNPNTPSKKNKKKSGFPIFKLLDTLPLEYRDQPHSEHIKELVLLLNENRQGLSKEIVAHKLDLSPHMAHKYLNILVLTKNVRKIVDRDTVFELDKNWYLQD